MDRKEKIEELKRLAELDPADPLTFFLLGSEHLRLGAWDESIEAFTRSLQLNPDHTAAIRLLADAYRLAGWSDQARKMYELAIQTAERTGDLQVAKEARALLKKLGY